MRVGRRLLRLVVLLGVFAVTPAAALAVGWGTAVNVTGIPKGDANVSVVPVSVSCASAGNCAVGGYWAEFDPSGDPEGNGAFVADERVVGGVPHWGAATLINGVSVSSVSCASAGNCAAGGYYTDSSGRDQAFVMDEVNGSWKPRIQVAGTASFGSAASFNGGADVTSVSCPSVGHCTAGGFYTDSGHVRHAFVVDQTTAVVPPSWGWGSAYKLLGAPKGTVSAVSCASAGNCAAVGHHTDISGTDQTFVADEVNGSWKTAIHLSGTASSSGGADVTSVSCPSVGYCAAGGYYHDSSAGHHIRAFVVNQTTAVVSPTWGWGPADTVLGATAGSVSSISCPSANTCVAGGSFYPVSGTHAFVVSSHPVSGVPTWGVMHELAASLNVSPSHDAYVTSVSCAAANQCVAGGTYYDAGAIFHPFLAKLNGTPVWSSAGLVPGIALLNPGNGWYLSNSLGEGEVGAVSCPSTSVSTVNCAVAGDYPGGAFVTKP